MILSYREIGGVIKRQVKRVATGKVSVSLPVEMEAWLREEADRTEYGNASRVVQRALEEYRLREGKKCPPLARQAAPPVPHSLRRASTKPLAHK